VLLRFARLITRRGAVAKLGSDLVGRLLQYALLWIAARQLSQGDFGDFTFALSIGFMLAQVADFGLQMFVQRELARQLSTDGSNNPHFTDPVRAGRLIGGGLLIKAALSIVAMILIGIVVVLEPVGNKDALIFLGFAMVLGTGLDYLSYCFRALGQLGWEAWAGFVLRVLNLALGVSLLIVGAGVWGLALSYVIATVAALLMSYRRLLRYIRPVWRVDWTYWRASLTQPTAVGIGVIFSIITFRLDNLLIPPIISREALATYNVAYKLFEPSLILPGVLLAATFPLLSRAAHEARSKPTAFTDLLSQTTLILLGSGIIAAVALALLAAPLIDLLYGSAYAASAPVLAWLALACIPMYVNYGLTHTLIAIDKPKLYAIFTLVALGVNIVANLALIPTLGIVGAAIATIATEACLLIACSVAVVRHMATLKTSAPPILAINPNSPDLEVPR
jgi:O-antigen/teichoic acid export membrane protein